MRTTIRLFAAGVASLAIAGAFAACGDDTERDRPESGGTSTLIAPNPTGTDSLAASDTANTYARPQDAKTAGGAPGTALTQRDASPPKTGGAPDGSGDPALPSQLDRKIIYNASIALSVNDLSGAYTEVSSIARVAGGYIEKSAFFGSDDKTVANRGASLTLRVPTDAYQDTLTRLRGVAGAKVRQEGSKSSEVTEQYTDLQSRLRVLQSTELQYLKLLEQAKTIPDILAMTDRLTGVRAQIEQVQGRIKVLDHLTELASIDVTLSPVTAAKADGPKNDGPKGIGEAFADAWAASLEGARYVASAAAVVAVAAVWLVIPAGLLLLGLRLARKRPAATGA